MANRLRAQGHGTLVVLSSVAGERARKANYIYGSAKAGLDAFAQGLADDLQGSGAKVLVVRPGFVESKMTQGLKPAPFATTPDAVADAVAAGLQRSATTIWVPGTLRYVFSALRHVPGPCTGSCRSTHDRGHARPGPSPRCRRGACGACTCSPGATSTTPMPAVPSCTRTS